MSAMVETDAGAKCFGLASAEVVEGAALAAPLSNPSIRSRTGSAWLVEPSPVLCRSYAGASTGWDGVSRSA